MFKDGGWVKALLFRKISLYGQSLGRNAFVAELRSAAQVGHLGPHDSRRSRYPHLPSGVLATVPNEPCRAALGRPGGTPGPTSDRTAKGGRPHVGIASSLTGGNCALGDYPFRIRSIGDYALTFLDHDQFPGRNVGKLINLSAGPLHLDRISTLLHPQAEGKHQFALR